MLQLAVILVLLGSGTYILGHWLTSAWLRLQRADQPLTLRNLLLLQPIEQQQVEARQDAELELGRAAWAKRVAAPLFLSALRERVAAGDSWEGAVKTVLGAYSPDEPVPVASVTEVDFRERLEM